jgi:AcrR family transcriptional regulator
LGRKKLFERKEVVDKALEVFWQKGYADTSLTDLELATDVFKASLYAEFGNKEGLYTECIKHYRDEYAAKNLLLKEPYGWKNIERFLKTTVPAAGKRKCFEANVFARDMPTMADMLKPLMSENSENILKAIRLNLKAEGLKPADVDAKADVIFAQYCGLGNLANILSKRQLEKLLANTMRVINP